MAKRSDIEAQIAALQSELDGADTDDEVWVKDDSGREVKVTGKRATTILGRFADLWDSGDGDDDDEDDDDDTAKPAAKKKVVPAAKDKKPATGGYFGRRS